MSPSETTGSEGLPEAVLDALVGVDDTGMIRFVSHQTEILFGYQPDDLLGAPLETLVPKSLQQVHAAHRNGHDSVTGPRPAKGSPRLRGRRRDGTEFPVSFSLSRVDLGNGILMIAAVRDLTEHRRAEALRRKLVRLSAVVESSGEAIISTTLDGTITTWNPAAERLYGYSEQEVVGRSDEFLSPADRTGENATILGRVKAGEQVEDFETVRIRKDGNLFDASLCVAPIRAADGTVIGTSAVAHDVTRQREASNLARSMIESSLDSLVAISPEGRITDVNEATTKVTGVSREKLIGTSFSEYFTEPQKAEQIYQHVFTEGMAMDYPLTLRHRDGHDTQTEVLYNASVFRDPRGKVVGVFAAARDVTKQMQAQRKIAEQQAKELDRLAELERFQRLTVGRELKMIELKKEIEFLKKMVSPRGGEPGGKH